MSLLALGIVGNRLKRDAYIFRGFPGRAALMLGAPDTIASVVHQFRLDLAAFRKMQINEGDHAGVKNIADRSCFNDVAVEQIVEVLRVSDWKVTEKVRAWFWDSFDGPLNSKIVEDCFKALSDMVDGQRNLRTTPKRCFAHLVQSDVIDKLHHWPAVETDVQTSYGRCAHVEEGWFKAPLLKPSITEMRDIQGFGSSVKWYSPGCGTLSQQATDLELMRHLLGQDMRGARDTWLCGLLRARNHTVVRRKAAEGVAPHPWVLPLLVVPDSVAFAWPCSEVAIEGVAEHYFKPTLNIKDVRDLIFPVTNLRELEAFI